MNRKKSLAVVGFLSVMALFLVAPCFGAEQDFSAAWIPEAGVFRIFSLQVGSDNYGVDFTVSVGSNGEIYFSPACALAPSGTKYSSWDGETICTPVANIGGASCWMKLEIVPELSTNGLAIFKLSDWYVNGKPVFGSAFNAVDGFGDWKKNLETTSEFSNVAMISSSGATVAEIGTADSKKIDVAIAKGMRPMIVLSSILFYAEFDESGRLTGVHLYENYRERLQEYALYIRNKGGVRYLYVLDEYDWFAIQCGMSPREMIAMVNEAIAAAKVVFPTALTVGVAATTANDLKKTSIFGFPVSASWYAEYGFPNFDLIGFGVYWTQFSMYGAGSSMDDFFSLWNEYMKNINKFILPGQKILLVPGTYEQAGVPIPNEEHLAQLNFYREVVTNPRVGAIVTFLWSSTDTMVGLQNLPSEVLTGWKNFGKEIITKQ